MKLSKKIIACLLIVGGYISLTSMQNHPNGNISAAEFKAQLGLIAWLDDFEFDAKCKITSFTLYYTPKRKDAVVLKGKRGRFVNDIKQVVQQAKSGDSYAFTDVKVKCPGDPHSRPANGLYFQIR